jgi:hypothetical protein
VTRVRRRWFERVLSLLVLVWAYECDGCGRRFRASPA